MTVDDKLLDICIERVKKYNKSIKNSRTDEAMGELTQDMEEALELLDDLKKEQKFLDIFTEETKTLLKNKFNNDDDLLNLYDDLAETVINEEYVKASKIKEKILNYN